MTSDVLGSNLLEASASVTSDVVESGSSKAAEMKADTPDSLSPTTISFIDNIFLVSFGFVESDCHKE
jgi:hypothetical protein